MLNNSGTSDDAHDTFQDTLEMILIRQSKGDLNIKSSLNSYLFNACKFRWIDHLRKNKKQGQVISLDESLLNYRYGYLEEMASLEESKRRYDLMDLTFSQLSELCQKLLTFIKEGKKPKELVSLLNMSNINTINRRKHACMDSWKKNIDTHKLKTLGT